MIKCLYKQLTYFPRKYILNRWSHLRPSFWCFSKNGWWWWLKLAGGWCWRRYRRWWCWVSWWYWVSLSIGWYNWVSLDKSRVFWIVVVICFLVFGVVVEVCVFSLLSFDVVEALLVVGTFFPLSCFHVVPFFLLLFT